MLTEAGRTFLPYAEAVLAALKDGAQAVQALEGEEHGAVSLGIVGWLAGTTIVEQLRRFLGRHRNARLELRSASSFEVSDMVRRGEVSWDFATSMIPPFSSSPRKYGRRPWWWSVLPNISGLGESCWIRSSFAEISGLRSR